MNGIIFSISFAFILIPTVLYPPLHKILRDQKTYKSIFYFTIFLPIISILLLLFDSADIENHNSFISFSPLFFLLLYKYYDRIILSKYGRHIYFFVRFNHSLYSDDESDKTTSLELWLGISLTIFPFLMSAGINYLILDLICKC